MLRLRWKAGCVAVPQHSMLISATRFTFDHVWRMPLIFWHARRLRSGWTSFRGGIGVSMCAEFFGRTTYTVSVWQCEDDLRAFIAAPIHMKMMRSYRRRVISSAAVTWEADQFNLRDAWREAAVRLDTHARAFDGRTTATQREPIESSGASSHKYGNETESHVPRSIADGLEKHEPRDTLF